MSKQSRNSMYATYMEGFAETILIKTWGFSSFLSLAWFLES